MPGRIDGHARRLRPGALREVILPDAGIGYAWRVMQNRDDLSKLAGKLGGLPVLGCRPGSPAAQVGIRYGDILLSVNGQPTPDWGAFMEARALDTREMVVEVFRGGQHVTHRLQLNGNERVDPLTLLAEMMEQRILPTTADDDVSVDEPQPS
jgi:C-terminal processing protease CtpA/Prc